MTHTTNSLSRRTALKKGGAVITTLAVGLPAISGTAAADGIPLMDVDAPPRISAKQHGNVTAAIYPGEGVEDLEKLLKAVETTGGGFKLGPHDFGEPDPTPDEVRSHADAVRWRLVNNGVHGNSVGVFFDPSTAEEWFTSDDTAAKISAVGEPIDSLGDIIAWGWDSVTVMDEEGQPQIE